MLSRRSRTLRLKSSSVHWSSVPPPEPPSAAERLSLSSLCMSPSLLGVPAGSIGQETYPLGGESSRYYLVALYLLSFWLKRP